jgi:hypothetical protein
MSLGRCTMKRSFSLLKTMTHTDNMYKLFFHTDVEEKSVGSHSERERIQLT